LHVEPSPQEFKPTNALEQALLDARQGRLPGEHFLELLLGSRVSILLDKDPGPSGVWDNSASPLILQAPSGAVLAMFTSLERTSAWQARIPKFQYQLETDFRWLLMGIAQGVGAIINPGTIGLVLTGERIAEIKAAARRAT
jgi:hypothetical protein